MRSVYSAFPLKGSRHIPENTYIWKVGDSECVAISDGSFPYPPQLFFASIPPDALEEELRARDLRTDHVQGTYTCLLIKTSSKKVLLDTGAGSMVASTGALLTESLWHDHPGRGFTGKMPVPPLRGHLLCCPKRGTNLSKEVITEWPSATRLGTKPVGSAHRW